MVHHAISTLEVVPDLLDALGFHQLLLVVLVAYYASETRVELRVSYLGAYDMHPGWDELADRRSVALRAELVDVHVLVGLDNIETVPFFTDVLVGDERLWVRTLNWVGF